MTCKQWTPIGVATLIALSLGIIVLSGVGYGFPKGVFLDPYTRTRAWWGDTVSPGRFFANDPSYGFHHLDSMNANYVVFGWENGPDLEHIRTVEAGRYAHFRFDHEYRPDTLWCYTSAQKSELEFGETPDPEILYLWHTIRQGNYPFNEACRTGGTIRDSEINKDIVYAQTGVHRRNWLIYPPDQRVDNPPGGIPPANLGDRWDGMWRDELLPDDPRAWLHYRLNLYVKFSGAIAEDTVAVVYLYDTGNTWDIGQYFESCSAIPDMWHYGWWSAEQNLSKAMGYEEMQQRGESGSDTIYVSDFTAPNEWQWISLDIPIRFFSFWGSQLFIGVYWTGSRDLYIDRMVIANQYYDSLFNANDTQTPKFGQIASQLTGFRSSNPNCVSYYDDEPFKNTDHTLGEFNSVGVDVAVNFGHDDSVQQVRSLDEVRPPWFYYDSYPFWNDTTDQGGERFGNDGPWIFSMPYVDSASTLDPSVCDSSYARIGDCGCRKRCSLQFMWDHIIDAVATKQHLIEKGELHPDVHNYSRQGFLQTQHVSDLSGIPWYAFLQGLPNSEIIFPWRDDTLYCFRFPSEAEMFCNANLALACGAKGIVYFIYSGGLIEDVGTDIIYHFNPTERYGYVKNIFAMLDTLGPVLDGLQWQASVATRAYEQNHAFPWRFSENPLTDIQRVATHEILFDGAWVDIPEDTSRRYVQIAVFTDNPPRYDHWYLMVVNRRCLTEEARGVKYTMNMNSRFNPFIVKHYLGNQQRLIWPDGWGKFDDSLALAPGHGELVSIRPGRTIPMVKIRLHGSDGVITWSPPEGLEDPSYFVEASTNGGKTFETIGCTTETTYRDPIASKPMCLYRVVGFEE